MEKKTYEGQIIFKTERLEVRSVLEMTIKTEEKKEKFGAEEVDESDIGFTHSEKRKRGERRSSEGTYLGRKRR